MEFSSEPSSSIFHPKQTILKKIFSFLENKFTSVFPLLHLAVDPRIIIIAYSQKMGDNVLAFMYLFYTKHISLKRSESNLLQFIYNQ